LLPGDITKSIVLIVEPVATGQGTRAIGNGAQAAAAPGAGIVRIGDVIRIARCIETGQAVEGVVGIRNGLAIGIGLAREVAGGIVLEGRGAGIRAGPGQQVAQIIVAVGGCARVGVRDRGETVGHVIAIGRGGVGRLGVRAAKVPGGQREALQGIVAVIGDDTLAVGGQIQGAIKGEGRVGSLQRVQGIAPGRGIEAIVEIEGLTELAADNVIRGIGRGAVGVKGGSRRGGCLRCRGCSRCGYPGHR